MSCDMRNASVATLTENTLRLISPSEVILVKAYDPRKPMVSNTAEGVSGFGAAEIITLVLPYVYIFFSKMIEAAGTEAGKRGFNFITAWLQDQSAANHIEARKQIQNILIDNKTPPASVDRITDALMVTLINSH